MPTPMDFKTLMLNQLEEIRQIMLNPDYLQALEECNPNIQSNAARMMSGIQTLGIKVRTVTTVNIRKTIDTEEANLLSGINSVKEAIDDITQVEKIILAARNLHAVIDRIICP